MAKGRLFEILYYLIDKKETTANELAEYFEVSVRTICLLYTSRCV